MSTAAKNEICETNGYVIHDDYDKLWQFMECQFSWGCSSISFYLPGISWEKIRRRSKCQRARRRRKSPRKTPLRRAPVQQTAPNGVGVEEHSETLYGNHLHPFTVFHCKIQVYMIVADAPDWKLCCGWRNVNRAQTHSTCFWYFLQGVKSTPGCNGGAHPGNHHCVSNPKCPAKNHPAQSARVLVSTRHDGDALQYHVP